MHAGARDMCQCEIGIGGNGAVECIPGTRPGRQQQIDAVAIGGGGRRFRRKPKPVTVLDGCSSHGARSSHRPARTGFFTWPRSETEVEDIIAAATHAPLSLASAAWLVLRPALGGIGRSC